ncbi:hypothetical protein [Corynebacterium aquilae]|nr:hypothetical protein [Corynebacterium aquilae]
MYTIEEAARKVADRLPEGVKLSDKIQRHGDWVLFNPYGRPNMCGVHPQDFNLRTGEMPRRGTALDMFPDWIWTTEAESLAEAIAKERSAHTDTE